MRVFVINSFLKRKLKKQNNEGTLTLFLSRVWMDPFSIRLHNVYIVFQVDHSQPYPH